MRFNIKSNRGFSKKTDNHPKAKRPYKPVTINSIQELIDLDGYIHSNIDNFYASYEKLNFQKPFRNLKIIKNKLIASNKSACEALEQARSAMEDTWGINKQELQNSLVDKEGKSKNPAYDAITKNFDQIFGSKSANQKREWDLAKIKKTSLAYQPILNLLNQNTIGRKPDEPYYSVRTRIEELVNKIKGLIPSDEKDFDKSVMQEMVTLKNGSKGKQTNSQYIVLQTRQILGLILEPLIAQLVATQLVGKDGVIKAIGEKGELADVSVQFNTQLFGLNIKSSKTEYINKTSTHIINPKQFWGDADYTAKYLPAATLVDYAFWNMIALRQYGIVNRKGLQLPQMKNIQKQFLTEVLGVYQLVYLYTVMGGHTSGAVEPNLNMAYIKNNPKVFTQLKDEDLENYYIILRNRVFTTDEVYQAMINKYATNSPDNAKEWAEIQKWIVATGVQANTLKELHNRKKEYIKEQVAFFGRKEIPRTRSDYISYSLLRSDPEIAKIIETIYRKWSLSKESYYVKYKVNIDQLLNTKTK